MRFRLHYEGQIRGNRRKADAKDRIRNHFSPQIAEMWERDAALKSLLTSEEYYKSREVSGKYFRPLVVQSLNLFCELDFLILAPQRPSSAIIHGDLDNRIKTVIDALRMPQNGSEVTNVIAQNCSETPICVLLEDDRLVSKISATTDVLLGCDKEQIRQGHVKLIISVHVYPKSPSFDAVSLIG